MLQIWDLKCPNLSEQMWVDFTERYSLVARMLGLPLPGLLCSKILWGFLSKCALLPIICE